MVRLILIFTEHIAGNTRVFCAPQFLKASKEDP